MVTRYTEIKALLCYRQQGLVKPRQRLPVRAGFAPEAQVGTPAASPNPDPDYICTWGWAGKEDPELAERGSYGDNPVTF